MYIDTKASYSTHKSSCTIVILSLFSDIQDLVDGQVELVIEQDKDDEAILEALLQSQRKLDHLKLSLLTQRAALESALKLRGRKEEERRKICPMCESVFPAEVTEEAFEEHVLEHLCPEEGEEETLIFLAEEEVEESSSSSR